MNFLFRHNMHIFLAGEYALAFSFMYHLLFIFLFVPYVVWEFEAIHCSIVFNGVLAFNGALWQEEMASPKPHWKCRVRESCPLNGDCLQSSAVYGCKITSNNTPENSPDYIGLTENTFIDRLYKHKNSFK